MEGLGGSQTEGTPSPANARVAQWLADVHEELDVTRYPARVQMLRAVAEAALRADSRARLEYALQRMRRP